MSEERLNAEQIAGLLKTWRYATDRECSECVKAVQSLVHEYRSQIAEYKKGERDVVDPLLLQGIDEWGRYILAQDDPVTALARLLGEKRSPGKRTANTERDRIIAAAVVVKMDGGMTLEKAVADVAAGFQLGEDTIKKIYFRKGKGARAERHQI